MLNKYIILFDCAINYFSYKNTKIIWNDILDKLETKLDREDSPLNVLESQIYNVVLIECYNNNNDG